MTLIIKLAQLIARLDRAIADAMEMRRRASLKYPQCSEE
jgi:hypothetical protein